jgi:hypothetical protein
MNANVREFYLARFARPAYFRVCPQVLLAGNDCPLINANVREFRCPVSRPFPASPGYPLITRIHNQRNLRNQRTVKKIRRLRLVRKVV